MNGVDELISAGSTPFLLALGILTGVSSFLQFLVPIYLLLRNQPRRERFHLRLFCWGLALSAIIEFVSFAAYYAGIYLDPPGIRYVVNFVAYSLLMLSFLPAVLGCFDTSVYNAAFAVTAGYTMQNLGTGVGEMVRIAFERSTGGPLSLGWNFLLSNISVILVLIPCYLLFIRKAEHVGRLDDTARSILGMLSIVIEVVIAYDVVIRGLDQHAAAAGFLLTLRFVHASVSIFILYAEYEMLYNARLIRQVAAGEALMAERERQYQLSRENISAMNARVHEVRHEVFRTLDAEGVLGDMPTESLREVLHELDVYDAAIQTGNVALNTVLTEKCLLCKAKGILLTCTADGHALDGLEASELYALFGGLLDQAIEAVDTCNSADQRSISLSVRGLGELALVHLEFFGSADDSHLCRQLVASNGGTYTQSTRGDATLVDVMLSSA